MYTSVSEQISRFMGFLIGNNISHLDLFLFLTNRNEKKKADDEKSKIYRTISSDNKKFRL